MKPERIQILLAFLSAAWQIEPATGDSEMALSRKYYFDDFANAIDFLCTVAAHGLDLGISPEAHINGGEVYIRLTAPSKGLTEEVFDLAGAIDRAA